MAINKRVKADAYLPENRAIRTITKRAGEIWLLLRANSANSWCDLLPMYSNDGGQTWHEDVPITTTLFLGYCVLAVDSQNRLHAIFCYGAEIYYSQRNGNWSAPELIYKVPPNMEGYYGVVYSLTLAIDADDNLHLAFDHVDPNDSFTARVYYMKRTGSVWGSVETVAYISGTWQGSPSIAVGPTGVHVVWDGAGWGINTFPYQILYRKRTNAGWQTTEQITDETISQRLPVLALDSNEEPHVVWLGYLGPKIQYQRKLAGIWQAAITLRALGTSCSIAIDNHDDVHVVYYYSVDDILWYRRTLGGSWQDEEILDSNHGVRVYRGSMLWSYYPKGVNVLPPSNYPIIMYDRADEVEVWIYTGLRAIKGNPNIDQLIYQHVERMD